MSISTLQYPPARSWRDIPQPVKPRAMSREGRKRRVLAICQGFGLVLVLGALVWGVTELVLVGGSDPARLFAPSGPPLKNMVVRSDGVLGPEWVRRTLALPPSATLLALDLPALKTKLLRHGQILNAELSGHASDQLTVTLFERVPVVRLVSGVPATLLAAGDGTVFAGVGYAEDFVQALPSLEGITVTRSADGYLPIAGLDLVDRLLAAARADLPSLASRIRRVSLARLEADDVLVVASDDVPEIVFGSKDDFHRQLARLDDILITLAASPRDGSKGAGPSGSVQSIDLAVGLDHVPVSFGLAAKPAVTATASPARVRSSPAEVVLRPLLPVGDFSPARKLSLSLHDLPQ